MTAMRLTGGCLCGKVRYTLSSDPLMTGDCHCLHCQKTSGAGHVFHVMAPESAVEVSGTMTSFETAADSGNRVTFCFCATCGSPILGRSSGFPGMVTLRAASLDEPDRFAPQMVVYAKRKRAWDHVSEGVPQFAEMPPAPPA